MNNFDSPGNVLTLTAPAGGVVSGSAYLIGSLVVIATVTVVETRPFAGLVVGVVDVTKLDTEVWTEGQKIYWDASPGVFTNVASGNLLVGVAVPVDPWTVTIATSAPVGGLTIAGLVVTIVDWTLLADDTVTVTIDGVAHVLTEGVDWDAATSEAVTATNLAAAIDALTGATAVAALAVVTVTADEPSTTGRVRLDGIAR